MFLLCESCKANRSVYQNRYVANQKRFQFSRMLSFRMLTFSSIFLSLGHIASGKTYLIETVDKKHQQTKMSQNNGNSDYSDIRHDVPSDRSRKHVDSKRSKSKRTEQKRNRMFETGWQQIYNQHILRLYSFSFLCFIGFAIKASYVDIYLKNIF